METNVFNTVDYATKYVDFYKDEKYKYIKNVKKKDLNKLLLDIPLIDGSSFYLDNFYKFIPSENDSYIFNFQTSGSSGKPKNIPMTEYYMGEYAISVLDMLKKIMGRLPLFYINIAPPKPAVSGVIMGKMAEIGKGIELVPGPGQKLIDLLRDIDAIYSNGNHKDNSIIIMSIASLLFREVYNLNSEETKELNDITEKFDLYLLLGGEPLDMNRAKLIHKLFKSKGVIDFMATTEGASGYRLYTNKQLEKDTDPGYGFIMNNKNIEYYLFDGKQLCNIDEKSAGKKGELVITQKSGKNKPMCPLINYNIKESVEIIGVKDGRIELEFLGRTNKVTGFGVSKLNDNIIDDVIAGTMLRYNLGEGYAEITREKGLDKMLFHFFKDNFTGDINEVKSSLEERLSKKEMELDYTIKNKLGFIEVDIVEDKSKIPFYTQKGKATRLVDSRKIEHY
ncbi:MAG: hypothetical protein QXL94_05020 [Candidatus Parvarchaeum sp.]